MTPLVFIGYDPREEIAYHVLARSIMRRATAPVGIVGLDLRSLPLKRAADPQQSTEFTYSRFLVPFLSGYQGWSLFMDCDMLCQGDIIELFGMADPTKAVQVVKHQWAPTNKTKFEGHEQVAYPKKCWSALMLFNNEKCGRLTPEYVNVALGKVLHQFKWCKDEEIGSLPMTWQWLAGAYCHHADPKIIHYTEGGPWFPGYQDVMYADEWRAEMAKTFLVRQPSEYLKR